MLTFTGSPEVGWKNEKPSPVKRKSPLNWVAMPV
jgi:hypothetical protein